jgi:hypothetical protein
MSVTVTADALANLSDYIDRLPGVARQAARLAINQVATRSGMKRISNAIYDQVAFPTNYLTQNDRLSVTQRATDENLEAVITGRFRPTSLARFMNPGQTQQTARMGGVSVQVKPGQSIDMKNAFLVKLRQGAQLTETQYNMGLAIRVKPGESVRNRHNGTAYQLFPNVFLLYGPSVNQVFRGVIDEVGGDIADDVGAEFLRQFTRLSD